MAPCPGGHHRSWRGAGRHGSGPWPQTSNSPPPKSLLFCNPTSTGLSTLNLLWLHNLPGLLNKPFLHPSLTFFLPNQDQLLQSLPSVCKSHFCLYLAFPYPPQRSHFSQISPHYPFILLWIQYAQVISSPTTLIPNPWQLTEASKKGTTNTNKKIKRGRERSVAHKALQSSLVFQELT